jgi:type IV secretion system protein TrbL
MACGVLPTQWSDCASDVAKSVAGDAFHSIAESFGSAADHAVNWLWTQMNAATAVHLGGKGFDLELGIVAAITGVVAVGLFLIQIIQSVLRREPGGMGRAVKGLVVAFIGGGAAIAVVNLLLSATDQLCQGIVQATTGTDVAGLGRLMLGSGEITSAVSGSAGLLLLSLACIAAAVIVYVALVIRKVLLVVTAVFAPLAFAGSLADVTVSWTRRWIETTVALIVSKLILVLIFVAGYGMLIEGAGQAGSGETQQVTQVVSGILVLCLAGFAPWLALKIVHFTGDHAHQLHALGSTAVGGAAAGGRMAQKAAPYATSAVGGASAAATSVGMAARRTGSGGSSGAPGSPGPSGTSGSAGSSRGGGPSGGVGPPAGTRAPTDRAEPQTAAPAPASVASSNLGPPAPPDSSPPRPTRSPRPSPATADLRSAP